MKHKSMCCVIREISELRIKSIENEDTLVIIYRTEHKYD